MSSLVSSIAATDQIMSIFTGKSLTVGDQTVGDPTPGTLLFKGNTGIVDAAVNGQDHFFSAHVEDPDAIGAVSMSHTWGANGSCSITAFLVKEV